jgi:hypothetical protein
MIYKFSYQTESDPKPHLRYYNALDSDTASYMFEGTCEETLYGENVVLLQVEEILDEKDGESRKDGEE